MYINIVILLGRGLNKNWKQIAIWEDNEEEMNNRAHKSARND